jgi:hypothetical protein
LRTAHHFKRINKFPTYTDSIHDGAFRDCVKLIDANIQGAKWLEEIAPEAFAQCTSLKRIHIPSTVTKIPPSKQFRGGHLVNAKNWWMLSSAMA